MARVVEIPYRPRNWAKPFHASFKRFLTLLLHRRAGKTTAVCNHHLRAGIDDEWEKRRLLYLRPTLTIPQIEELIHPPGGRHYGHVMPTRVQAKAVAWDKLKHYAAVTGGKPNEAELLYRLANGNKIQLFGADEPDSFRGIAFSGLSFDEFSQQPANIFSEVLSKALADHLGYAIFLGTIKGKDHLYKRHEADKHDPDCFTLWQDIDRSLQTEEGVTIQMLQQAMADDRKDVLKGLMTQEEFDQEWYLSVEAAIKGAFYLKEMSELRRCSQICRVPYDPALPVDTDWDLGIDAMAIWFTQRTRAGEVRVIDYHEDIGGGLPEAIKALKGQQSNPGNDPRIETENARRSRYTYGEHWAPHDIETTEIGSGKTRRTIAKEHGITFKITPRIEVADGITAVRVLLPRCYFDEKNTERGIDCLRQYKKTWQQSLGQFSSKPVHDWASHGADAFRGLAVRYRLPRDKKQEDLERERKKKQQGSSVVSAWS